MQSDSTRAVISTLKRIPAGAVASYGAVATLAGLSNGARQVVRVLHACAEKEGLPWFRILRRDGSIALPVGGGFEIQKEMLEREGVSVSREGKVDLRRYGWEEAGY